MRDSDQYQRHLWGWWALWPKLWGRPASVSTGFWKSKTVSHPRMSCRGTLAGRWGQHTRAHSRAEQKEHSVCDAPWQFYHAAILTPFLFSAFSSLLFHFLPWSLLFPHLPHHTYASESSIWSYTIWKQPLLTVLFKWVLPKIVWSGPSCSCLTTDKKNVRAVKVV